MSLQRRNRGFTALRVEGGILPPEFLQSVAALEAPHQSGAEYGLSRSLALKEELARYWRIAGDLHRGYAERRNRRDLRGFRVGVEEWLAPLLRRLLGYHDLAPCGSTVLEERTFRLTHRALGGAVPMLLVTHDFDLDKFDKRLGEDGRRQAAHGTLQEYLNAEDAALWGLVSNGSKLRLLRDNASLSRPSFIEADLDLMFAEELYADFAAFWLMAHASRLEPVDEKPSSCIIEAWRAKAHQTGERVRENLRYGVTQTLRQLGSGFLQHRDSDRLRESVKSGTLSPEGYFQQLLQLVYRMLFLFTAEERGLIYEPSATEQQRAIYSEGYALSLLRERVLRRRHYDRNVDLWQGLKITFAALAGGAPGLGLPALGGLFRRTECPDLDQAVISNEDLLEAVRTLAFFRSGKVLARVNYRDMDTEELGSVYESLLELVPVIKLDVFPWVFQFSMDGIGKKSKGSERKLTGSYYTPPALVGELVQSALDPLIAQAIAEHQEDPRSAIIDLRVVDPACGSGHFLLAAARRLAAEIARIESGDDTVDEAARQRALRDVVQHCIHGVDRNPFAVELCKTALWIETLEPGKPLTFLDSHILQGDSLVGILNPEVMANGIPAAAYKPLAGDERAVCLELKQRNRQAGQYSLFDPAVLVDVVVSGMDIDDMPEGTLIEVERKRKAWEAGLCDETRIREQWRADLFVGAYLAQKSQATLELVPHTQDIHRLVDGRAPRRGVGEFVRDLIEEHHCLHWHVAFAEIMQDGGFHAVLGNPPWERIKLQEQEFFELRSPKIASAPNKAVRDRLIRTLDRETASPQEKVLFQEFRTAKRRAEASSQFVRTAGRFPLTGIGDVNTYAVFAETCLQLLNPRGRAGLIVPTGIATDDSTKEFFEHVISGGRLVSLFDFENREKVFPGIDGRIKFCLLTLSGADAPVPKSEFAFFLRQVEQLKEAERRFGLTAKDFALFNPNTRTCPTFRAQRDMEIARKMYRCAGVFWNERNSVPEEGNPWGASFQRMFDMSNDSGLFKTRQELDGAGWVLKGNVFVRGEERYLPLYEAKLFHQYDHRFATFDDVSERDIHAGKARLVTGEEKRIPDSVVIPRYWVPERNVLEKLEPKRRAMSRAEPSRLYSANSRSWLVARSQEHRPRDRREDRSSCSDSGHGVGQFRSGHHDWLAVFRDVSNPTNQRTSIFMVIRETAVSNKAPLLYLNHEFWIQAFRGITNSTNERTLLMDTLARCGAGNSAPVVDYENARSLATALVLGNMNSLPLDWAARVSVGGVNLNFYIVKQLPVLPPEAFLREAHCGHRWVELIVPRVLELTYTSNEMRGFAGDLGFEGPPFMWNEPRRHCLRSELDAMFACMYGLNRSDLEWILDAQPPGESFPSLKKNEVREFGEYRTQRLVLRAFDLLERGMNPDLFAESHV